MVSYALLRRDGRCGCDSGGMRVRRGSAAGVAVVVIVALAGCGWPGTANGSSGDNSSVEATTDAPSTSPRSSTSSATTASDSVSALPRLVDVAEWVERDGTRALKVTPSQLLRDSSDPAVFEEAWRRVLVAIPAADEPGLKDQFVCHAAFAASKDAWYLEPDRPDVGYWETVRAGCNPGDVRDVG